MDSVVDREGMSQEKFGENFIELSYEMQEICHRIKGHINDARDNIQGKNAVQAMNQIEEMMSETEKSIPDLIAFGETLKKKGKIIQEAENIDF